MNKSALSTTTRALIDLAWYFGANGPNGECCAGLSIPEFLALDKVSTTLDCPVQSIGQELGFTKSGATRVVNRLQKKKLILRVPSQEDGRICCIHITETGKNVLSTANEHYTQAFQQIHDQISDDLKSSAAPVIQALANSL